LIFHIFGSLAEFERDLIRERTLAGLTAARARGRRGGRPQVLTPTQVAHLRVLAADRNNSVKDICRTLRISRATFYRYLK
jgi:DNA invertase Pin-like site-specific DNA recombinase